MNQTTSKRARHAPTVNMVNLPITKILLFCVVALLSIGLVMVASASIPYAERINGQSYFYIIRQLIYAGLGIVLGLVVSKIPIRYWFKNAMSLWMLGAVMLIVTLFFPEVNGSSRWISFGGLNFQTSELVKLFMVIFTADYVIRRSDEVRFEWIGFLRLCIPMMIVLVLIMLQPDLGASVVIAGSMMTIFFLAGAPIRQFLLMMVLAVGAVIIAILLEPYRLERVRALANPWADEWETGFQLTRSLMAIGRGELAGVGLGQSVFKLAYLPEAHTDFLIAIIGEEFGFIGITLVVLLLALLVFCAIYIGQMALKNQHMRAGYLAYGIACILIIQTIVNVGMNMGLLPTKGLTLPLISYGGSSLLTTLMMMGILFRIHFETMQTPNRSRRYY